MSLFCHGTDKEPNYINDSKFGNPVRLHLVCKKSQFFNDDLKLTSKTLSKMSCKESQEPEIIRENESDCSKGLGADGRSNTKEKITLVKVGWNLDEKFHEQVNYIQKLLYGCVENRLYFKTQFTNQV